MPNRCLISQASQIVSHAQSSSNSTTQLSSSTTSTKTKLATHCLLPLFLPLFFFLVVSETPWCEEAPRFPQLTTASHSHFICPLLPLPLTLLFSNKTLSRRRSLFILPSFQTTGEGHQGFTTDSHFGEKHFFPLDAALSLVWSALLFLSYRRDKSVKDKDKYKDKTVKEAPSCFPAVQIVFQVSQWDHHEITRSSSPPPSPPPSPPREDTKSFLSHHHHHHCHGRGHCHGV